MRVGTKSVLFGAHCFFLHPCFVAAAWWKLFGFPWDPRLWAAFFAHDIGYIGLPNMDGEEGEWHPATGAALMAPFDQHEPYCFLSRWKWIARVVSPICNSLWGFNPQGMTWYCFCFYHSRFLAKRYGTSPSRLCVADKYALCLTPAWLYLPMVRATGEIREYMKLAGAMNDGAGGGKYSAMNISTADQRTWYRDVQDYLGRWVAEHRDGRADTWTPSQKQAKL
jgi:hypothetical protein